MKTHNQSTVLPNCQVYQDETDESPNSETKAHQAHQHHNAQKKTEGHPANRVPCRKVQIRIINMKQDTRQLITQSERNNSFRKIILDTYDCKRVMVAETEDLIIEYCMTTEKVTNLCAKEGEEESLYGRMRKRHLRDWPDDTLRLTDDGLSKTISEFRKQLLGLKHYTASL